MRLVVKTVTKQELEINVGDNVTVGDLKTKIDEEHGYIKDGMKLVFKGKMLEDAQSLKDAGLTENESIVMVAKKRANVPAKEAAPAAAQSSGAPAAPAATPAPAAAPVATPAATTEAPTTQTPTPAPAAPAPTPTPAPAAPAPAAQAPAAGGGDSFFATGSEVDAAVAQLIEITGCDAPTAQRALRAAFNNPDRAVEYIFSGSIPNVDVPAGGNAGGARPQGQVQPDVHPDAMDEEGDEGDDAEGQAEFAQLMQAAQAQGLSPEQMMAALQAMMQQRGGGPTESPLVQALRSVPQFPQIRQIILQQPAMMEAILQQVQQTNPQLHQLIRDNAQEFMNILQNGLPAPGAAAPGGFPVPGGAPQGGAPGGAPAGGAPPGAAVIQLTPDEAAAVGRLQSLGFPRHAALEAYLACDKNEEAAANYLFDNATDFG